MSLTLPAHGEDDWDVKLNTALTQLDGQDTTLAANLAAEITRATLAEAANATAITAEATARATAITNAISGLVNGAPGALDTLNELATALAADESAATTLAALVATKAPLASPTFTGTPAVPTAAPGTNTTQAASTAFTTAAVAAEATARNTAIATQATTDRGTYAPLDARDTSITTFTAGMLVSSGSAVYKINTTHAAPFDSTKATQLGGTSVASTLVNAKGDLLVGTADDVVARKGVGTDGTVLTADSAQADGLRWATPTSLTVVTKTAAYTATMGDYVLADTTGRSVANGATTSGSTTITSATIAFTSADVGREIQSANIPGGATIASVTNSTTAVLSIAATATSTSQTFTISGAFTVTLPAAATNGQVGVKLIGPSGYAVTVVPPSGTIDGSPSVSIGLQYVARDFVSDGTNWFQV